MSIAKITASKKQGVALKNEMANYTNSLRSIRDVLLDNENYTKCPLYKRLQRDIEKYIARTIWNMKRSGAIRDDSTWTVLRNMRQGSEAALRGRFRFYTGTAHPPIPVRSRR